VLYTISSRRGRRPAVPEKIAKFMKKFLLGLIAVAAVLLPMSQNAQAHVYYHHYWGGYHYAYGHRYWHHGYWYGGFWHAPYWAYGPGPVIIVAP
jgi:hypothetical protein